MSNFVLLATAWGSQHGGINSFNRDFGAGLAQVLGPKGRVFCAVLNATKEQIEDANRKNVTLLSLEKTGDFTPDRIDAVRQILEWEHHAPRIDYWIGHDVITGFAAVKASEVIGRAALIMHMDYSAYLAVKHPGVSSIREQFRKQTELFKNDTDAALFAMGPLLSHACRILSNREPTMLIPGFPQDLPKPGAREGHLSAITFGRFEIEDDRIKNGRLAVVSYAGALIKALEQPHLYRDFCDKSLLSVIGLGSDSDVAEVQQLARQKAARQVNIVGSGFETEREPLLATLVRSNLALMLSWHEGFGLTGWEAIAAEVPLILTVNSGLFKLIESLEEGGHASWKSHVIGVDITGDPAADEKEVSSKILEVAATMAGRLKKAKALKQKLIQVHGCTWEQTARVFLRELSSRAADTRDSGYAASHAKPTRGRLNKKVAPSEVITEQVVHETTRKHFFLALAKSRRAVEEIYGRLNTTPPQAPLEHQIAALFAQLLNEPVGHALALLAKAHKTFSGESPDDSVAAKSIRCAVRSYVEVVFSDELIESLRPWAKADGVFLDLPAQTITGAEIVEAKLQGHPARFVETTLRAADGISRPGRPRGAFAMPMPPTCGPDTLERFGQMVEEWLHDKLAYPGEKLTTDDIRRRLAARKTSGDRRYYFVVNAPEWSANFNNNASWYAGYQSAFRKCIVDLNTSIPQIAFFSLTERIGDEANEETTTLQSVFSLLHVDEECP